MKLKGLSQGKWLAIVGTIMFFALVFVLAMFMHGLGTIPLGDGSVVLPLGLLFAVLGAGYGSILALDRDAGISRQDRPLLRSLVCGALGAIAVLLVQSWPPQTFNVLGPACGFLVGAILGWLGWSWAKYIDF